MSRNPGIGPLKSPAGSDKAQRQVSVDSEPVLGWRPALGQVVSNTQWVLEQKLGEGGFGEVRAEAEFEDAPLLHRLMPSQPFLAIAEWNKLYIHDARSSARSLVTNLAREVFDPVKRVSSVGFSRKFMAVGYRDGLVKLWRVRAILGRGDIYAAVGATGGNGAPRPPLAPWRQRIDE